MQRNQRGTWQRVLAGACVFAGLMVMGGIFEGGGGRVWGQAAATQPEAQGAVDAGAGAAGAVTQPVDVPQPIDPNLEPAAEIARREQRILAETLTDEQVVEALKKGADFLISTMKQDNWESGQPWRQNGQHGGETALALYALLNAGESLRDDPVYGAKLNYHSKELAPAVAWLCRIDPDETYTAALMASALALLPQKPDDNNGPGARAALQRAYRYLFTGMGSQGGYTYGKMSASTGRGRGYFYLGDLSNAQYGALGMWALADAGFDSPAAYWQTTDRYWRRLQSVSGSWPYVEGGGVRAGQDMGDRPSMGVAGIATLYVAQEFTDKTLRSVPISDKALDLGLSWLDQSFVPGSGDLYYMYGVERVGLASGLKFFGTKEWYRQCAADIIEHQQYNGSWIASSWLHGGFNGATATTSTSYALLFLARGRNPILFNKLQYEGPWNARPRDDAFLTRYLSKKFERPLNWQVVNLNVKASTWQDAPILLITGSVDPGFTATDIQKFREFINAGGMIFSTADDSSAVFTNAMRKYAGQVVNGRYEMRQMPKTHMLFAPDLGVDIPSPPALMSMSNGVREIWVHSPVDMGASWQLQRTSNKINYDVPAALYFYATGRMPMAGRLKTLDVAEAGEAAKGIGEDRRLNLARVVYGGNFDPEPGAWPRFERLLRAGRHAGEAVQENRPAGGPASGGAGAKELERIDLEVANVAIKDLDPAKYPVAHMTGTARFLQKDEEVAALRRYLEAGGTLIADAAGGSTAFGEEFLKLAQKIYPEAKMEPLPPDHSIFTGNFGAAGRGGTSGGGLGMAGENVSEVTFRRYGAVALGKKITAPTLQGMTIGGRLRIIYSPYDITSGLLGTNTWGVVGYSPESAQKLAGNIVRWAIDGRNKAAK